VLATAPAQYFESDRAAQVVELGLGELVNSLRHVTVITVTRQDVKVRVAKRRKWP